MCVFEQSCRVLRANVRRPGQNLWTASTATTDCCGMQPKESWGVDAAQRYDTPRRGLFALNVWGLTVDRIIELVGVAE